MDNQLPSLITPDSRSGLALAGQLADRLHAQIDLATTRVERPGGMNYLQPAPVPKEITTAILYYAIAAANRGWPSPP